jgi:hypothetical protein
LNEELSTSECFRRLVRKIFFLTKSHQQYPLLNYGIEVTLVVFGSNLVASGSKLLCSEEQQHTASRNSALEVHSANRSTTQSWHTKNTGQKNHWHFLRRQRPTKSAWAKKKISKSGWYISYSSNIHIKHYITKIWSLSISQPCLNKASQGISSTSSFSTLGLCKACGAQPIREIYYINPFIFFGGVKPVWQKTCNRGRMKLNKKTLAERITKKGLFHVVSHSIVKGCIYTYIYKL